MTRGRLPSDPCELLREVGIEPAPEQALERVALRLRTTLGTLAPPEQLAPPIGPDAASLPSRIGGWFSPVVTLPAVFIAGVAVGGVGLEAMRGDSPSSSAAALPTGALVSAAPRIALPSVVPPKVEAPAPAGSASVRQRTVPSPAFGLAEERTLLDRGRSRMAAREPEVALEVLDQHARRYPRGLLAEEREAMAINALVELGRAAQAERRGRAFHARFPSSLVGRSVDAALATLRTSNRSE